MVEEETFETKQDMLLREKHYIKNFDCVNKYVPTRSKAEYHQDNKEYILNKVNLWSINNPEKVIANKKRYAEKNRDKILEEKKQKYTCECGSTLRCDGKKDHLISTKHQEFLTRHPHRNQKDSRTP